MTEELTRKIVAWATEIASYAAELPSSRARDVAPGVEKDGNCRGRGLCRERGRRTARDQHADLTAHQIRCERRQPIVSTFCPAKFERKVATFDIALLAQALPECSHMPRSQFWSLASEKSDHRQRRLLRAGRKRPRRRATEQSDELAAADHRMAA